MLKHLRGRHLLFVTIVFLFLVGGCAEEKERTRQDDNTVIREIIAQFETWTSDRDVGDFSEKKTDAFDAAAFIDALWEGIDAERVVFKIRRLRVSEGRARAVIDVSFLPDETMVEGKFVVVELVYLEDEWKADSYQLFGPGDNL